MAPPLSATLLLNRVFLMTNGALARVSSCKAPPALERQLSKEESSTSPETSTASVAHPPRGEEPVEKAHRRTVQLSTMPTRWAPPSEEEASENWQSSNSSLPQSPRMEPEFASPMLRTKAQLLTVRSEEARMHPPPNAWLPEKRQRSTTATPLSRTSTPPLLA